MTRRFVYGLGFWLTAAATALTIAAILTPKWVSWDGPADADYSYGLHRRCSSITGECEPFPSESDCRAGKQSFCAAWRSVGFFMSFTVIIELATWVSYITVLAGGKQARDYGWKVVCSLLAVAAAAQCAAMAIIAYLYNNDERFFPGWQLDTSWILCTVSWSILFLTGVGIVTCACVLPEEGGYELFVSEED